MVWVTGDTHGNFVRLDAFCRRMETVREDTMIILGDAGFNYYLDERDIRKKEYAGTFPATILCIHGNHEARPRRIPTYQERDYHGGRVLYEEAYPNILFAMDGEVYDFDGYSCIAIGGAYSVDKQYRLAHGWGWWPDEQPDSEIRERVEEKLSVMENKVDIVLSHTCPFRYQPVETFLSGIDQSKVDKSTELWLGEIESRLDYRKWYCGHFHISKRIDRMQFLFEDYQPLSWNSGEEC